MKTLQEFITENKQEPINEATKGTIEYELILKCAKALRISYNDAEEFIIGGGGIGNETAENAAKRMGYDEASGEYDTFWKKIYTRIEFSVMMHIAAGNDYVKAKDPIL